MSRRTHHIIAMMLAFLPFACAMGTEEPCAVPAKLKAWRCAEYTQRYFIRVEAPGEAGSAGLVDTENTFANVALPLKMIGEGAAARPERVALFDEDGNLVPIYMHKAPGGSESEVVFPTYPGHRRFCLYAGSTKPPAEVSALSLRPVAIQVHLRGVTATPDFVHKGGTPPQVAPLTLQRFLNMEQQTAGAPLPPGKNVQQRPDLQPNIDDAECPFFWIDYDIFDRTNHIYNPPMYAALYEGFLRCPVSGKYKFAIDTPGAVHLVIDGVPVISADMPDDNREPFKLNNTVELSEGLHRVVVHYAEANADATKTNADDRRFGLRLHWQPPFARTLLCIPPLAFVNYLPGVVAGFENGPEKCAPFIHIETLGHVRAGAQLGDGAAREYVLACARMSVPPGSARLRASASEMTPVLSDPGQRSLCVWVPAGEPVEFRFEGLDAPARVVTWPTLKTGTKELMEREVMDMEAELLVKSAPEFLYPNETGHIHLETMLSPKPAIIHKTRFDAVDFVGHELLPPLPRPMGEYNLFFEQDGIEQGVFSATPEEGGRKKLRASFNATLDSVSASSQLSLRLVVGGVECQREKFRMVNANAPAWPGKLELEGGELMFAPAAKGARGQGSGVRGKESGVRGQEGAAAKAALERVVILVPHEDEAAHRHLGVWDELARASVSSSEALFIGDPLVEGAPSTPGTPAPGGLSALLAKNRAAMKWTVIDVEGPHRYRPVLRMLADLDELTASNPNKKLPKVAVVNLGIGDVARQTPLHTFERALDTLVARLTAGGVEKIVLVGVIPEPWREKQCEPYQERVANVVRSRNVSGIDVFDLWTKESDWTRRFATDKSNTVAGPLPNAAALDEVLRMILQRL
ncbi:MAG TPA: GDSL-type esterase/lipase family protein [Planctomycetota bacterium]|nr:GDSL-type esterase/lipase family protein [Planctomycetota bacterium]